MLIEDYDRILWFLVVLFFFCLPCSHLKRFLEAISFLSRNVQPWTGFHNLPNDPLTELLLTPVVSPFETPAPPIPTSSEHVPLVGWHELPGFLRIVPIFYIP